MNQFRLPAVLCSLLSNFPATPAHVHVDMTKLKTEVFNRPLGEQGLHHKSWQLQFQ